MNNVSDPSRLTGRGIIKTALEGPMSAARMIAVAKKKNATSLIIKLVLVDVKQPHNSNDHKLEIYVV